MSDLTRLLQTLQPTPDGESAVRHRTALVDAVNADGTVDLDFDGTVIPDVSVLDGAAVDVGNVVQVAAWAGDLLVLGAARSAPSGPRGVLGYAQVTADQSGITAEVDLTGLASTVTIGTSRRIKITMSGRPRTTVAGDFMRYRIKEGAAVLKLWDIRMDTAGNGFPFVAQHIFTPSAGSHTYKLSGQRVVGTGSLTNEAASTYESFILVEDIGPA